MKTMNALTALVLSVSGTAAKAQEGAFYVDPKLAQTVFAETREEAHNHGASWTMGAMIGVQQTGHLIVDSDLFTVDYTENKEYLPIGAVSLGRDVWSFGKASGEVSANIGYSSYRDSVSALSKDGVEVVDNMVLQVLPIALRHTFSYTIPNFEVLTPQVLTEVTQTWLHQSGTIDGIEASYWQSGLGIGLGAVILADKESGFGGITVSSMATRDAKSSGGNRMTHMVGSRLVL